MSKNSHGYSKNKFFGKEKIIIKIGKELNCKKKKNDI